MNHRKSAGAAALALIACWPAGAHGAPSATSAELGARAGLSRAELARYVAGARSVGGLTQDQVQLTLRRPELMAAVPISVKRGTITARRARGCRWTESYVWMKSVGGVSLWRFAQSKYWCWNERTRRVTSKNITIKVRIRQAAALSGWDYKGLDENGAEQHHFEWGGARRGGHRSMRRGLFKWCPPPKIVCLNTRRPTITLYNYYDGHVGDDRAIG